MERLTTNASTGAMVSSGAADTEQLSAQGRYVAHCYDKDGNLKWEDDFHNLVTTVGKNDMLDKYLAGSAYTAAFYMGLISSVGYSAIAAGDSMSSHAGWAEAGIANAPTYSQGSRPAAVWAGATAGSKALNAPLTYSITSAGTVKGAFLGTNATKDGTTGILFSAGLFSGGDKVVSNGDTITVTYTLSV